MSRTGCRAGGGGWGTAGGSGEGKQREAEARLWLRRPLHGPQREGRWPMGNWAVRRGQLEPQLRTGLSPDGVRGCRWVCWGRTRLCRGDLGRRPRGCWHPQTQAARQFLPFSQAAHEDPTVASPHGSSRQRPEEPGSGAGSAQELSPF